MRVALYNLTTTTQFGGVESFVWSVARCLAARGVETTIIGGRGTIRQNDPNVRVVEFPFLSRERMRRMPGLATAYTLTKLIERLSFGANALAFMRREHFDIVHIQKPYDLPPAVLLKSPGASKIIFGCHGTDFFPGDRFFAPRADASVSCSAFNAEQIRAHYGFTPRVIYNGIDPQLFKPQPRADELRRSLAGDGALIFYAGRLVRWKGVQYLIRALAKLSARRDATLVIAGAGEFRTTLEQLARELDLSARVRFVGYVPAPDLPRYYAASDIVTVASYANETFSISSLEAMACERPVVGSNFGGIPEVVTNGESGLLARPEDADDFANKFEELLEDAALRERMGRAGRQRACDTFTWEQVTERAVAVYNSI